MSEMTAYDLKGEDRIDSRDVIAAQDALRKDIAETDHEPDDDERTLLDFDGESEVGSDWIYGVTMILESDFTSYAQELAEDIGAIDPNAGRPLAYIDWDGAADALRGDYMSVTFLGHDYLVRA